MIQSQNALVSAGRVGLAGFFAALAILLIVGAASIVSASPNGAITQSISVGALSTDIKDQNSNPVATPSFSLSSAIITNECQTTTGVYGSNTQRVYADNPGAALTGWTLSVAATDGASAKWQSGPNEYDFDDPANGGCDNGQLSIDPSIATLTIEGGTMTGISLGPSASFNNNSAITLLSADGSADTIWRGYLTGIGLSQKIPSSTPSGSYVIDLTQTIANI